jgi:hypothetical protein
MAIEPLAAGDPDQVAGYRLHGRLGVGGMGVVYLAFTPGGRPESGEPHLIEISERRFANS